MVHPRTLTRRGFAAIFVAAATLVGAACSTPTVQSDGESGGPSSEPAPSSTELFDIDQGDPLPFPGYDIDRVTIAPLPKPDASGADGAPLTGWAAFDASLRA